MDPRRWQRIDELFNAALDCATPAQRQALLADEDDAQVREEVAAMLTVSDDPAAADRRIGGIVQAGLVSTEDLEPERIGPYRLVSELGRGGLATVYLAERDDDQFSRRVAIKLIRGGLDSEVVRHRLRLERQILANLDHPHIARLIDGGTEGERSYFVMEAITGERIDRWCERRQEPVVARLELLRKVCDAVDYAHRNLVLHRDIKPSNLLVTDDGVPKLLDFGIAKLLAPNATGGDAEPVAETPTLTMPGMLLLTPEFASPEQIRGETLTTASDVYSMGVLLYLLTTGRRPYELDRRRLAEVEQVVGQVEPEPPSAVVRRARRAGEAVPPGWPGALKSEELDRIVLMALNKEPARRYTSAGQLGEDLRRFLADLPVMARRDTWRYRARKFVRRHRLEVVAATLVFVLLLTAVAVTSWQASVARAERARADSQRLRAQEVATFLQQLFKISDPFHSLGEDVTARQMLDEGALRIRSELSDQPRLRADLMTTMGKAYQNLAFLPEAEELLDEALAIRRQLAGEAPDELTRTLRDVAELRLDQSALEEAEALLAEALASQEARPDTAPAQLAETLHWLAKVKADQGEYALAEALFERAFELHRNHVDDRRALNGLLDSFGEYWYERRQLGRAEEVFRVALGERRKAFGEEHPEVVQSLNNLAVTLRAQGDSATAEQFLRQAVEINRRLFGPRHNHVAMSLYNLSVALESQGRFDEALAAVAEALEINVAIYGEEHSAVARLYHGMARLHRLRKDYPAARRLVARAYEIDRSSYGDDNARVIRHRLLMAELAALEGDAAAESLHQEVLAAWRRTMPPGDPRIASSLLALGRLLLGHGEPARAEPLLREALEIYLAAFGENDWRVSQTRGELGRGLVAMGQLEEAEELLLNAHASLRLHMGPDHVRTRAVASYLQELRERQGRTGDTVPP